MNNANGADKPEHMPDKADATEEKQSLDWSIGLCQCCSYTSPETGKCVAVPILCPQACCCPALILGANASLLQKEKPVYIGEEAHDGDCNEWLGVDTYFKLGEQGSKVCLNTCLLQSLCYGLCAGLPVVSVAVYKQRQEVMEKYNMPPVTWFAALTAACLYPCSLFQVHATLEEQHYVQHAPVFKATASGIPTAGPLTRGATNKAFRGSAQHASTTSTSVDPPEVVDMKRSVPAVRPTALQIPEDDFLSGGDVQVQVAGATSRPSTHDSHHTMTTAPPATPSPAATPQSLHRRQAQATSTTSSYSSTAAQQLEITSAGQNTNPYSGWGSSGIELTSLSNPTMAADMGVGSSGLEAGSQQRWNRGLWGQELMSSSALTSPSGSVALKSTNGDLDMLSSRSRSRGETSTSTSTTIPQSSSHHRHLPNPFAPSPVTPSSPVDRVTAALAPWQYDVPNATSTLNPTFRPTRAPPLPPVTSADSDLVLTGVSSLQHPSLQRTSMQLRRSVEDRHRGGGSLDGTQNFGDLLGPSFTTLQAHDHHSSQRHSNQAFKSSLTGDHTSSLPVDSLPEPILVMDQSSAWPSSILRPPSLGRKNKRYENMMASMADHR